MWRETNKQHIWCCTALKSKCAINKDCIFQNRVKEQFSLKANNLLLTTKGRSCSFVGPSSLPIYFSKIASTYIKLNTKEFKNIFGFQIQKIARYMYNDFVLQGYPVIFFFILIKKQDYWGAYTRAKSLWTCCHNSKHM